MILAIAALSFAAPRVVELIDPTSPVVSAHVMVPIPEMGAHDQAVVRVMASALTEDTDTFGKEQWREYAARAGSVLRCDVMLDHIELSLNVTAGETKNALSFLHAIVRRAKLPAEALSASLQTLPYRHQGFLTGTLMPETFDYSRIRRPEVVDMYHRLFRPENITVAVGGPIEPGEAQSVWAGLTSDWTPPRLRFQAPDRKPVSLNDRLQADVGMIDLRGPEFVGGDVAMPTRLLALIALGSGKGSSLFRVVREKQGWSYLQSAILWPTAKGFIPRLLIAQTETDGIDRRAEEIRTALLADVKGWTQADLDRARGMAKAVLTRGLEDNPFFWRRPSAISASIEDRTFMAGYWAMKTGSDWDPNLLQASMETVSLEDFRQSATDLLAGATARIMRRR